MKGSFRLKQHQKVSTVKFTNISSHKNTTTAWFFPFLNADTHGERDIRIFYSFLLLMSKKRHTATPTLFDNAETFTYYSTFSLIMCSHMY